MIEQLISLLRQNEISLDDREISDILWLARVLPHTITEEQPSKSPTSSTPNDLQPGSTPRQPESISATKSRPVKPSIYTSGSSTTGEGVRASRVRLPAATALPDAPAISRAFRPFARRYQSGRFRTLDIEKTIQRTAETRFLHPVFQALPERWFDVALVVEDTSTMAVWQQTIHEMATLLERQGSFRDVRLWRLQCNDKKITVRESSGVGRAPEAINDPSGRRLIMMLSDCSSRAWRDGTLAKVILNWAVSMPVLVAHLLSEKLWRHTATGVPDSSVRSSLPGQPNALLTVELPWWGKEEGKNYIPLPLVALNPDHIGQWAGMVMKPGLIYDKAILLTTSSGAIESPALHVEETLEPEQREQRFRAFVSPETYALAIYLSVTPMPLSLPLIRLVQSSMLPHPRQEQIAELLLGGIIRRKTPIDDSRLPDEVEYEFIDGIKEILERWIFRTELNRVFRCVSVFLEQSTGTTFDFIALLENPAGEERVPETVSPFTRIARSTLRRLGISYEPATSSQTYSQNLDALQEKPFAEKERGKELISYVDNALHLVKEVQSIPAEADRSGGVFSLPFSRNTAFIGRDDTLKDIHKNFKTGKTVQALSGIGGVGKTQIALEYAYRYQENYQVVLWANAHSRESLVSDFVAMAGLLKLPEIHVRDQVETISAVKRWFENNDGWLLILDKADDLTIVREFIPSRETGHVLLTTRARNTKSIAARQAVEGMGPQEGALYLLRRLGIIKREESLESAPEEFRNQAEALSKAVDNLPLALDQAAAFIGEKSSTLEEYQSLYQRERKELLRRRGKLPKDHPSVTVTFLLAFQKVADANPAAADLLRVCAFLEADSIPEEIFSEGAKELGVALASAAESPLALTNSIGEAARFSLLWYHPEARTLSLHRLVQAVLKDEMDENSRRVWAERAVRAVNKIFPTSEHSNWQACSRLIQHAQSLARAIDEFRFEFPEAARMLNQAGEYLNERAQFANAEPLFRRALAIREKVFGIEHESVASSLNNLAGLYYNLGTYAEAESTWSRALTIMENAFGNEDMRVATVLNNLAELYKKQGRYVQAEPLYHQSLAIYQNTLGDEHQRVAVSFNNLAALYLQQGKYAEAEPLLKRALDIKEKLLGSEHPDVATSLNDLAVLYYSRGRYAEAEPLSKRALDIRENAFGAAHPEVANSLNTLAELYRKQGNYAEAEPLDRRALDIREKALSADHPDVATSLNNLALSYSSKRMYAEAESLHRRALDLREKALGPEHPDVANSLENLAGLYFNQGKHAEVEPLLKRALDIREKALGPGHPYTSTSLYNLVEFYRAQARYAEAEQLCRRALAIREKALGAEHPDVAVSLNNLAALYYNQGKYAETEPLYRRALAIREKALGAEHPEVANSLNNLAGVYHNQGKYAEAEPLYQRALVIYEKALGAEHPDVATSLNNLAALNYNQGKYAEAELLLARSLAIREKALGAEHPDVANSLNNLAEICHNHGKYAEAEPLHRRALAIREKALGAEHPDVATSLNNLALLYENQGKYAEAEPLYWRALSILEKALGAEHPSVATSLNNLALLNHNQGKYAETEPLYRRALAIREKALGAEHPEVANSLNNLAGVYHNQGKYAEAEPLYQRALVIYEKALGAEHPEVATSLNNLAALNYNQGKYTEAEPLYRRALAILEKAFGAEHPDVAISLNNLADIYRNQGKYTEAEPLYRRALAIREKALGTEHPDVATVLRNYSSLLRATNKESEAEKLENRASIIKAGRTRSSNSENDLAARNKSALMEEIKDMKYDVAISFAGEQREEARDIAEGLKRAGVKVFFDEYEDAELWGKNLYEHLSEVYKDRAQYCIILISAAYAKKVWTSHERRSAQARALQESQEYILPVRIDDTELPALLRTVAYLDFNRYGADGICQAFLRKIGRGNSVSEVSPELKITTSSLALIREADSKIYRFIPVLNSKWGSSRAVLTLGADDPEDGAYLDGLQARARMTVAYGNHVAICKVMDITHNKDAGASRWELTLHPESSEFGPAFELGGFGTTSKDEYAQKRVRRLLLNEELPGGLDDLNQMMEEIFIRGQGDTVEILGSPFPQLYRKYGKEPKEFLEIAWVTGVYLLRTSGTVAEIPRFELTLTGQSLTVDFIGRRKKEFSNRPAYEIKVQGTCDLGRQEK